MPHNLPFRSSSKFSFLEDLCVPSDLSISPGMTEKRIPKLIHKLKLLSKSTVNNAKTNFFLIIYCTMNYVVLCWKLSLSFFFGPWPLQSVGQHRTSTVALCRVLLAAIFLSSEKSGFQQGFKVSPTRFRLRCVIRHKFTERECLSQLRAHLLPVVSVSTNKDTSSSLFSTPPCSYTRPRPFEATSWVSSRKDKIIFLDSLISRQSKSHTYSGETKHNVLKNNLYNICLITLRDTVSYQARKISVQTHSGLSGIVHINHSEPTCINSDA